MIPPRDNAPHTFASAMHDPFAFYRGQGVEMHTPTTTYMGVYCGVTTNNMYVLQPHIGFTCEAEPSKRLMHMDERPAFISVQTPGLNVLPRNLTEMNTLIRKHNTLIKRKTHSRSTKK